MLGVDRGVDKADLKKAYRQKARKFHPDVNKEPGAEDMFKKISNAYEVLNDDQKRGIYDRQAVLLKCCPIQIALLQQNFPIAACRGNV